MGTIDNSSHVEQRSVTDRSGQTETIREQPGDTLSFRKNSFPDERTASRLFSLPRAGHQYWSFTALVLATPAR